MKLQKLKDEDFQQLAHMLKSLAEPTRMKILQALHNEELCVSDIVEVVGTGQANISKHLKVLAQNNLIKSRREGTTIYYSLYGAFVGHLCSSICDGYESILNKKFGGKK